MHELVKIDWLNVEHAEHNLMLTFFSACTDSTQGTCPTAGANDGRLCARP